MRKTFIFLLIVAAVPCLTGGVSAENIRYRIHEFSSFFDGDGPPGPNGGWRHPENMMRPIGVNIGGEGTHSTASTHMWLSNAGLVTSQYVILDLGAVYNLNSIRIWNSNEPGFTSRAVQFLRLRAAINPQQIAADTGVSLNLPQAPGNSTTPFAASFALSYSLVRFVRLEVFSNYGDPQFVGLAHVDIHGDRATLGGDVTYDLAGDYSEVSNPNGPWSFHDINGNLLVQEGIGAQLCNIPAWHQPGSTDVPVINTSQCLGGADNEALTFGPLIIRWRSGVSGEVTISGWMWQSDFIDPSGVKQVAFSLNQGPAQLASGAAPHNGSRTLTGPEYKVIFEDSPGAGTVTTQVTVGEEIDLRLDGSGPAGNGQAHYAHINLSIQTQSAVTPMQLTLTSNPGAVNSTHPAIGVSNHFPGEYVDLEADTFYDCPDVYHFFHWAGDVANPFDPRTSVIMDADKTVSANYNFAPQCADLCHPLATSDFNLDCRIDINDLNRLVSDWLAGAVN